MGKKLFSLLLSIALVLSLVACGSGQGNTEPSQKTSTPETTQPSRNPSTAEEAAVPIPEPEAPNEPEVPEETQTPDDDVASSGSDVLVVYFSRTGEQYSVGVIDKGNTAIVAEMIIEATGADAFEILPEEDYYPYTYKELTDVAKQEQNENARPAYQGDVPDLSQYSTIFIGAPVWWGDWPMILYTFFEENAEALAGKTLIPFSTHAGSGLSGFDRKLAAALPDSTVGEGLAVFGSDAQNKQDSVRSSVEDWLGKLGF